MPDNLESFTESELSAFVESDLSARDAGGVTVTHRKYSADDPPEITWNADHGSTVYSMAVSPDGTVYTTDGDTLRKWDSSGALQWEVELAGVTSTTRLAADNGSAYVVRGGISSVVEKYDEADGSLLNTTTLNGQTRDVIVFDGFVYVTVLTFSFFGGPRGAALYRLTTNLGFVWFRSFGVGGGPVGLGVSSTHIYVARQPIDNAPPAPAFVYKVATDSTIVWTGSVGLELGAGSSVQTWGFAVAPDGTSYVIDDQGDTAANRVLRVAQLDNSGTYQGTYFTIPDVTIDGNDMPLYAEDSGDLYGIVSDDSSWGQWDSSGTVQFEIDTNVHARQRIHNITKDGDGNHYAAGTRVVDPF